MAQELFREINELIGTPSNRYVDEWKAAGKPVIGYFCQYMPPELILAAGALPLRMRGVGSEDSSHADAYLSGHVCTYVRHTINLVLEGYYDFLDGEISLNSCDHVRRCADVLRKKTSIAFHGFISVPRNPRESLYGYYRNELQKLLTQMRNHFGVRITDDDLREAIAGMNANRRRLHLLNALRRGEKPKLSGAEALGVHIASQVLPPAVFAEIADRLIEALNDRPGLASPRGRLILIGAELDEPEYVAAVESQGALVVADMLCFGERSVLDLLDEKAADPLDTIARAYFFRPSCARMIGDFPNRWENLKQLATAVQADGIVFEKIVFCDPWAAEQHNLIMRSKREEFIPMLTLSREYGIVPTGQVKTRVQAFVEKIEIARTQKAARGDHR
ncbi:MAG: 2-hydroxyacyl-CoA dehydratase [Deltaproteobacteria bacterium]|jgi:benzoyl-CoA reductase/2-hydroxyglutaryl-CoA dehydratase subunit BcrC/BadD/HgdB|nr:2-hydroxyacyl-CoA dehydratase [Deltaproteobacteria bacterium]